MVFASLWKCSLSPVRFLQDIGPRNRAFARLDATVSTAPATLEFEFLIFDGCFETYVGLKFVYVWFRVDLGLV